MTLHRKVDAPVPVRREGHTLTSPVAEEVVIEQRLLVKEELWRTTRWLEGQQTQPVTLRRAEVVVEELNPSEQ